MLPSIYLASLSPRLRELLGQIGVDHEVIRVHRVQVDETPHPGEAPAEYVIRLALEKAGAGLSGLGERSPRPVLGADTAVVADGRILGKPAHRGEALEMISLLSGRSHKVLTGVALTTPGRE